jgi:Asp-tRNA(Asn)/Glu-tRNA(Gln) amidotransferase A subunit family amidase
MSMTLRRFLQIEWSAEMLTEAGKLRKSVTNQMWRLMSRFDYLLTPTTNDLPPRRCSPASRT